jgi:hypothetical protein
MLSKSSSFQTWVDADDDEEALESIHIVAIAADAVERPLALINIGDHWSSAIHAGGTHNSFTRTGSLALIFEVDVLEDDDDEEAAYAFLDAVGAIIDEVEELSGQGGYLSIHEISMLDPPARSIDDDQPTEGDFYRVRFLVTYGI